MTEEQQYKENAMELIAYATIVGISQKLNIHPNKAIAMFMDSEAAESLFDERTGDYQSGPLYMLHQFMKEKHFVFPAEETTPADR